MRSFGSYLSCLILFLFMAVSSWAQVTVDLEDPVSAIQFEVLRIDLGETLYVKDSTYVYYFSYENTGTAPLIVNKVVGHCPCVKVKYSTEPLSPGDCDTISVYFTPSHASKYSQQITVFNNSSRSVITLYAKGNFMKPSTVKSNAKSDHDE